VSHSYNYRVQWRVDNKHFVNAPEYGNKMVEVHGIPYLRFEFSAPKIIYGHNLFTIDWDLVYKACLMVATAFEEYTGVELPESGSWYTYRVDCCANFLLNNLEEVEALMRFYSRLDYPRRDARIVKNESVYFASVHNTVKLYAKGPEFKAHDAERFLERETMLDLQGLANRIIRFEVECKRRLKYLIKRFEKDYNYRFLQSFHGYVPFNDLSHFFFDAKFELERCMKMLLGGTVTKVMTMLEVFNILKAHLTVGQAQAFYGVYSMLMMHGQQETKRQFGKDKYYRALRCFRDLGISSTAQDQGEAAEFTGSGFPQDFSLEMSENNKYYQVPKVGDSQVRRAA
jgi:II/X family phage/plasmid replication protein